MSGRQYRKPKRRNSREREDLRSEAKHDADLEELWSVLAETKASNSWGTPWNRGMNAAALALELSRLMWENDGSRIGEAAGVRWKLSAVDAIQSFLRHPELDAQTYWMFQEHLDNLTRCTFGLGDQLLACAVRMLQLDLARSDGGGIAYNTNLCPLWDQIPTTIGREKLMRRYRCEDALGISPEFTQVAGDDRLRRAFYTAWDRGLYQVAYAIGRNR